MEPRQAYETDLTDAQWERLEPLITVGHQPDHWRRKHSLREIVNTLLYQLRNGCAWENLPHDLPPKGPSMTTSTSGPATAPSNGSKISCVKSSGSKRDGKPSRVRPSWIPRA